MSEYKRVPQLVYARPQLQESAEGRFWSTFRHPVLQKHAGAVTNISISPTAPHDVAVTAGSKVVLYCSRTNKVKRTFSRFNAPATSGNFRYDGKMLAAGCGNVVKAFEVSGGAQLREFKGHTAAVNVVKFALKGTSGCILSGSDDYTVRRWDLASGKATGVFTGHTDYVRAAAPSTQNTSVEIWATGGYDHTVRLWDMRLSTGSSNSPSNVCTMQMDHGAPVDDVLYMPSGGIVLSAGGPVVKVWDILSGGKLLHTFSNHQKAITSLSLDGTGKRILSAGLDGLVKIYDSTTYGVTHQLKYTAPLMSCAVSKDNMQLVVGMADGVSSIRHRAESKRVDSQQLQVRHIVGGSQRHFKRGRHTIIDAEKDLVVKKGKKKKLSAHDKLLKSFSYGDALDAAIESSNVVTICSLLKELVYRGGLQVALQGRNEESLEPIVAFLVKYTTTPRYSQLLLSVCSEVIDLYACVIGQSVEIDQLFFKLQTKLQNEVQLHRKLGPLQGCVDLLISAGEQN
eukprot:GSMAST32.ASY1.ANO1.589.1 assembled CDS